MQENQSQATERVNLLNFDVEGIKAWCAELGEKPYRAIQLARWMHRHCEDDFDAMSNLAKSFRAKLHDLAYIKAPPVITVKHSADGTRKWLFDVGNGNAVEAVFIPEDDRGTLCISTQAGCAMGCAFCATGAAGLSRSLTAAEIYEQVMHVRDDFNSRVTSVVMMGQGEPFMNYDATLAALRKLNDPDGAGIGARHLTVSTCGVIPQIMRFANEPEQFTLAISLHSAVQRTRNALMPGVRKYSLINLYNVMGEYVNKTGRRPTYEYALIGGVNDTDAELQALCDFCEGTLAHVNLIQLNEVEGSKFRPSTDLRAQDFVRRLASVGVEATVRNSRGSDIDAACGQLRQRVIGRSTS